MFRPIFDRTISRASRRKAIATDHPRASGTEEMHDVIAVKVTATASVSGTRYSYVFAGKQVGHAE
ncbi:uncharacterized protein TRAVEDRAFT_61487 [Trametes versicolor FP-101664 SS1]|uniref:Uncharacterized protein n=1 Tax=Trametes versicolor (strain FP-101664) TaxID=717944 RepID=R7S801_TRAVS|nr:uncharacterized protein TRAVEDRAFT_61487 [Trametes versicolor FP-101664 SS1]EIW51792.1 hypothetical protein TRAVEDRAFT_61487 [Trametes versicolor FP-101664 SS1]